MRIEERLSPEAVFREQTASKTALRRTPPASTIDDTVALSAFKAEFDELFPKRLRQLSQLVQAERYSVDTAILSKRLLEDALATKEIR